MADTASAIEAFNIDTSGAVEGGILEIPVQTFITEMEGKATLLTQHAAQFEERVFADSKELATRVMKLTALLREREAGWLREAQTLDSEVRFWFGNKDKLYALNRELQSRLLIKFKRENDLVTLAELKDIGACETDSDAISDGRRHCTILKNKKAVITNQFYQVETVNEMIAFLDHIDKARTASLVDRTAPNELRILRDKAYLALVEIDREIAELADGCFVHEPQIRAQYVSAYKREKNRRANKNRAEKLKSESTDA